MTSFGSYWVEFENAEIPIWKETAAPGIDGATMPHLLVSIGPGTFEWKEATGDDLAIGDLDTNSFPSFIGEKINDVFFTESRLAFLAGESVVMSKAGEFFNFFRTTTTALVDADPIDVGANYRPIPFSSLATSACSYPPRSSPQLVPALRRGSQSPPGHAKA